MQTTGCWCEASCPLPGVLIIRALRLPRSSKPLQTSIFIVVFPVYLGCILLSTSTTHEWLEYCSSWNHVAHDHCPMRQVRKTNCGALARKAVYTQCFYHLS